MTTFELKIIDTFVTHMLARIDESNAFTDSFGFALLAVTLIILTWQMPNIASGIAGGAAVSSPTGWAAAAVAMTRRGGGSANSPSQLAKGGGSIGQAGSETSNSPTSTGSSRRIPAYRRATLDRLNALPK